MKKLISIISRVWLSICMGGISFAMLRALAHWYIDYLKSTGGVIMARDYASADFFPALLAIVITGMVWYTSEGLNE